MNEPFQSEASQGKGSKWKWKGNGKRCQRCQRWGEICWKGCLVIQSSDNQITRSLKPEILPAETRIKTKVSKSKVRVKEITISTPYSILVLWNRGKKIIMRLYSGYPATHEQGTT